MDITNIIQGLTILPAANMPLYLQLANALQAKIISMEIPRGTRLPPERELARLLDVSRTTTLHAYRHLEQQGLIISRRGSGTYVNGPPENLPAENRMHWQQIFAPPYKSPFSSLLRTLISPPLADDTISLGAGMPDPSFYPLDELRQAAEAAQPAILPQQYGYLSTEGYFPLRQSLAAWQKQFGHTGTPDQYLIVSGSQQGLYLIVKTLIEPQDYVILEAPAYMGAIQSMEAAGARLLTLPTGKKLDFSLLEDYLIRYRPKLFYTVPTFHNPTGWVLSLEERKKLLELASRYRLVIIEDDPYSLLYYDQLPPPSLKSLDTYGGVIRLGTFSKILLPGLRLGWVEADQAVIDRLAQEKQHVDLHCNNLSQLLLTPCLQSGLIDRHLRQIRREYKLRRDAMIQALRQYCSPYMEFTVPQGGFYIWCRLKSDIKAAELMQRAAVHGVSFVPGIAFYTSGAASNDNEIRLCFSAHAPEILREGIRRIGKLLAQIETRPLPPDRPTYPLI